jgi:hypothetical protein
VNDAASRYAELAKTLHSFAAPASNEPMSFGSAVDQLDQSAYTLTATLMVLPFLQPIPLGLFALVGSAAFMALGIQLFKGQVPLQLPAKIRAVTLNVKVRRTLVNICLKILKVCRCMSKPRLAFLVEGRFGRRLGGLIFISVGLLVAIPLGGVVPFKNLFPGLAVLLYCTGEMERDGFMVILALSCLLLTVILYSALLYLVWKFGTMALEYWF